MLVTGVEDQLRQLEEAELDQFIEILRKAYPVMLTSPEARESMKKRMLEYEKDTRLHHYGLFRQGLMVGGMRLFDFKRHIYR